MCGNYYIGDRVVYNAIERFLRFVIDTNLTFSDIFPPNFNKLFLLYDNEEIESLIDNLYNKNIKLASIVPLGIDNNSSINLIDFINLKDNLLKALAGEQDDMETALSIKEFKNIVDLFFKGHGEKSLFKNLDLCLYYFKNGLSLLSLKEITDKEYFDTFIEPGKESWLQFVRRINKYAKFIVVSGFEKEIQRIWKLIDEFNKVIPQFETPELLIEERIDTGNLLAPCNEINDILNSVAVKFGIIEDGN